MRVFNKIKKLLEEKNVKYEYDEDDSNEYLTFSSVSNNFFQVTLPKKKHGKAYRRTRIREICWDLEIQDPNDPKGTIIGDINRAVSWEDIKQEFRFY